ncbi:hypothetical protein BZG35_05570 [Brevundimonas sp. LM2]|nr:hypothetical protein BZG35_05570 [Brevundimonas sp. LM2]
MAGRLRIAHSIRDAFRERFDLREITAKSAVQNPTPGRIAGSILAYLTSLFRGQVLPFQSAIFASHAELAAIEARIPDDASYVYLDGVRLFPLLSHLRRHRPNLRLVVDFDDLMSRRFQQLFDRGEAPAPGYLAGNLHRRIRQLLDWSIFGRLVLRHEAKTLAGLEKETLKLADAIVLLSLAETQQLQALATQVPDARAEILNIGPSVAMQHTNAVLKPLRFIFVGTDRLTQNRLTIDYLIDLWRRLSPSASLTIYGQQVRDLPLPDGVSVAGYVDDLSVAYDDHSVLLTPSFLAGGVKTKVLESFSYGRPVVANPTTFEGMNLTGYPLVFDRADDLEAFVLAPDDHLDEAANAADVGAAYLIRSHAPDRTAAAWCKAMLGDSAGAVK